MLDGNLCELSEVIRTDADTVIETKVVSDGRLKANY